MANESIPHTPGWQTSEFILSTVAIVLGAVMATDLLNQHSTALQIAGVAASVLGALGYSTNRSMIKSASNRAAANAPATSVDQKVIVEPSASQRGFFDPVLTVGIAAGLGVVALALACGSLRSGARGLAAGLVDCTKTETAKVVGELGPVVDAAMINAVGSDSKLDWTPIRDLTKGFSADVGGCVLADAVTRALKPRAEDPQAPRSSPLEVDRDSLRDGFAALSAERFGGQKFHTAGGDL